MRVVVNRISILGQRSGIGHCTAELLRCLRAQAAPGEVEEFPAGLLWKVRRACAGGGTSAAPGAGPAAGGRWLGSMRRALVRGLKAAGLAGAGEALTARALRRMCARGRVDLYHEPNHIPLACDAPTLLTIHDLSVLLHPEWHPADRLAHHERHFRRGVEQAAHFLAGSDYTRREIIHVLGVAPQRVTRVHHGIRPQFRPLPAESVRPALARLGLPPSYLLHVGTLEPRKNLLTLARAYCDLPGRLRQRCPLLLVGGWGWGAADLADFLDRRGRAQGIIHLGYLPDEDLPALYNGARALVYPSLYEGFGLPPVEMLACGGAVLCSTADAVVETAGAGAHLIDPHDVEGWRDAMARVIEDDRWWQRLRDGAAGAAQPFTWERAASETLALYRTLTGNSAGVARAA